MKWITDKDFHDAMDKDPNAVYLVTTYTNGDCGNIGIFSTKAKAEAWLSTPEMDDVTAVVVPFVIDEPDFGNRRDT